MIGVLIIGDEILSGRREDKHLSKSIELLGERGLKLSWARYVGDEPERIVAELSAVRASGDVVFSFGGIGATPDDHTRAAAATAWDVPLTLHAQAKPLILERSRLMAEQEGRAFDASSADTIRRLDMGCFPVGADIIPNPYNQIPGFSMVRRVHFLPGFPVMAWPMMAWVLDTLHANLHGTQRQVEMAVIVYAKTESALTPLMLEIESRFPEIKVFSLPSVDHPVHGRHVELGVKGEEELCLRAFAELRVGLLNIGAQLGPEMVRK